MKCAIKNYAILAVSMKSSRAYWRRWAKALQRYQLQEFTVALLEAGSPLAIIGAQTLYFGQGLIKSEQLKALAETLEEEGETRAFASFLAQEGAIQ